MKYVSFIGAGVWMAVVVVAVAGCGGAPVKTPATASSQAEPIIATSSAESIDVFSTAAEEDSATLSSVVTAVTVYSDRARITRKAEAVLSREPQLLVFRRLPGWVDDGSVRVSASGGRILDVRVERDYLARSSDENYRKAEDAVRDLNARKVAIEDEIAILEAQKVQIESIKAFSLEKITRDTTIGDISVASYSDVVTFISDALRATATSRREAQARMEELLPTLEAAQARLNDMTSLLSLEETGVYVSIVGQTDEVAALELTYMMPGATWEPVHELRVNTKDAGDVEVMSFAAVNQTSGEDWNGAELSFSTQSTVQSMRIPELEALTLGGETAAERVWTSKYSSFSRAQKAFEGQSHLWNKMHSSSVKRSKNESFEKVYQSNIEYLQTVQTRTVQIFASLEKRGTTAHFRASAPARVRGDGQSARMRIGFSPLKSRQRIIAVPEQTLNAAWTLEMTNGTGQALLPGKVALYQDGAFIGLTDIDFIAKEETFSLFFSVADHIKLNREIDRKKSEIIYRKGTKITIAFVVTAENLGSNATTMILSDRIPVSETRDIRVTGVKIAPAVQPDPQGILKWDVTLKPGEKRQFLISYQVEYPPELIIDARRARANENRYSPSSTSAPRSSKPASIQEILVDLEAMF